MSALQIDNPTFRGSYKLNEAKVKEHILKVVATFPLEYRLIGNGNSDRIAILNIPISPEGKAIVKDQIISCQLGSDNRTQTTVDFEITNEDNKISSYTELERDKNSLNNFRILLQQEIDGTLAKTVARNQTAANAVQGLSATLQIAILIFAIFSIVFGAQLLCN